MEVCFKCHKEIKKDDKFIYGDPDGKRRGLWWYGDRDYGTMRAKPIERNKYHLECFEEEKKYFKKLLGKRIKWGIIMALIMIVSFALIFIIAALIILK